MIVYMAVFIKFKRYQNDMYEKARSSAAFETRQKQCWYGYYSRFVFCLWTQCRILCYSGVFTDIYDTLPFPHRLVTCFPRPGLWGYVPFTQTFPTHLPLCADSQPYPMLGPIPKPMTLELTHYIITVLVRRHSFGLQCGCFGHEVAGAPEAELKGSVGEEEQD